MNREEQSRETLSRSCNQIQDRVDDLETAMVDERSSSEARWKTQLESQERKSKQRLEDLTRQCLELHERDQASIAALDERWHQTSTASQVENQKARETLERTLEEKRKHSQADLVTELLANVTRTERALDDRWTQNAQSVDETWTRRLKDTAASSHLALLTKVSEVRQHSLEELKHVRENLETELSGTTIEIMTKITSERDANQAALEALHQQALEHQTLESERSAEAMQELQEMWLAKTHENHASLTNKLDDLRTSTGAQLQAQWAHVEQSLVALETKAMLELRDTRDNLQELSVKPLSREIDELTHRVLPECQRAHQEHVRATLETQEHLRQALEREMEHGKWTDTLLEKVLKSQVTSHDVKDQERQLILRMAEGMMKIFHSFEETGEYLHVDHHPEPGISERDFQYQLGPTIVQLRRLLESQTEQRLIYLLIFAASFNNNNATKPTTTKGHQDHLDLDLASSLRTFYATKILDFRHQLQVLMSDLTEEAKNRPPNYYEKELQVKVLEKVERALEFDFFDTLAKVSRASALDSSTQGDLTTCIACNRPFRSQALQEMLKHPPKKVKSKPQSGHATFITRGGFRVPGKDFSSHRPSSAAAAMTDRRMFSNTSSNTPSQTNTPPSQPMKMSISVSNNHNHNEYRPPNLPQLEITSSSSKSEAKAAGWQRTKELSSVKKLRPQTAPLKKKR